MPDPTSRKDLTASEIKDQLAVFRGNSTQLQRQFGPVLRQLAVEHLRKADTPFAREFRNRLSEGGQLQKYLTDMSQNGTCGTEDEYFALCEAFELHPQLVKHTGPKTNQTYSLVDRQIQERDSVPGSLPSKEYGPMLNWDKVSIQHSSGHFFVERSTDTLGQGNCLFHAVATVLHRHFSLDNWKVAEKTGVEEKESDEAFALRLQKEEARLAGYDSIANVESVKDLQGNETYKNLYAEYQSPVMHSSVSMFGTKNPVNTAKSQSFLSRFSDFLGLSKAEQSDPSAAVFPPTA